MFVKNRSFYVLPFLAMVYVTIKILSILLFYKVITIFSIKASAGTVIIPLWFLLGDVITEVYGYKVSRRILYLAVLCQVGFALIAYSFNSFSSANIGLNQEAYSEVISHLPRVALVSVVSILVGGLINAGLLQMWKLKLNGRYFSLRSLGSSTIGELAFTVCAYATGFVGVTSYDVIIKLMAVSYLVKICLNPLMILPISVLTTFIKNLEERSLRANLVKGNTVTNYKSLRILNNEEGDSYFIIDQIPVPDLHALGKRSEDLNAKEVFFREMVPGSFLDWHNAPKKQYIFYLSGSVEVVSSTGQKRIFYGGDVLFAADLQGKGHTTRVLQAGHAVVAVVD